MSGNRLSVLGMGVLVLFVSVCELICESDCRTSFFSPEEIMLAFSEDRPDITVLADWA